MHLVLIGLRGAGKTTVGRMVSQLLSRPFIDLDDRAAAVCGADAVTCFATHGEQAWREAEAEALHAALAESTPSIIALGGGTPTAPGAEQSLSEARHRGMIRVAWLDATPEILSSRIGTDPGRPPLTGLDPLSEMRTIDAARRPIFERLCDQRVDVGDRALPAMLGDLIALATRG